MGKTVMVEAIASALSGIQKNLTSFNKSADKLSKNELNTEFARDVVDMKVAKKGVELNASVLKRAEEMTGTIIDILA